MYRAPKDVEAPEPWIVAPSLAACLGLIAMVGLELSRSRKDARWQSLHRKRKRDRAFARASAALCTLSGVRIPKAPSKIVRAHADIVVAKAAPIPAKLERLPVPKDPLSAIDYANEALARGAFAGAAAAARNAMGEPVYACDAHLLLASALIAQGKAAVARKELVSGAALWLERPREFYNPDQLATLRDLCMRAAVPKTHALAEFAGVASSTKK